MKLIYYASLLFLLASCTNNNSDTEISKLVDMPSFNLLMLDSLTVLNTTKIPNGQPIVMIYFSPECQFCKELTKDITDNIDQLEGIQFYLISPFQLSQIKAYSTLFALNKYSNVVVGQDPKSFYSNFYGVVSIPYITFYNKNKQLVKTIAGKVNSITIKEIINNL